MDLTRLPYPIVAFEAPWEKEGSLLVVNGLEQRKATRRIALCWELDTYELIPGMADYQTVLSAGGVFILPIFWIDALGWQSPLSCILQPYANQMTAVDLGVALPASRLAIEKIMGPDRINAKSKQYICEPIPIFLELFQQHSVHVGHYEALSEILLDCGDESNMLVQACATITCSNIKPDTLPVPSALNRKRVARGKQPFFEYKVLQLAEEKWARTIDAGDGGTYASPRMHL